MRFFVYVECERPLKEVHPNEPSYKRAKKKLDSNYWNKGLHIRDLVHKLKHLPKMDNSAAKVAEFATAALGLMSQLEEILELIQETLEESSCSLAKYWSQSSTLKPQKCGRKCQ